MGLLDSARQQVDRAVFATDKARRIKREQGAIRALRRQIEDEKRHLAEETLALHDRGELVGMPTLLEICGRIDALRQQIGQHEAEIERLRRLEFRPAPQPVLHGHICPRCQMALPAEANFCPQCGSTAIDVAPSIEGLTCAACGAEMPREANFCPQCGAPRTEAPMPPIETAQEAKCCERCGGELPAEADFCPHCGYRLAPAEREAGQPAVCHVCGQALASEAVFCPRCGATVGGQEERILARCPECDTPLRTGALFCPQCGASVESVVHMATAMLELDAALAALPEVETEGEEEIGFLEETEEALEHLPGMSEESPVDIGPEPPVAEPLPQVGGSGESEVEGEDETSAARTCPHCGAAVPDEAAYCSECLARI